MAAFYQRFLRSGIDLAPLGAARSEENFPYFCTPRGASIFAWAGVDGIHFCFVRGWGEMVFAVSPANGWGEYVHPIARDFADFLRLLLACGDTAALEQAWQWEQAQFSAFLAQNPPTEEQKAVLSRIAERFSLAPMDDPWHYLRKLQAGFDYGKLKFTDDLTDPDMNPAAPQQETPWAVYYGGGFWRHHGTDRAGKEIPCGKWFSWAGREWYVPAYYVCSKGLVLDLCMKSDTEEYAAYLEKWGFDPETGAEPPLSDEQREEAERENPLAFDCSQRITLNGAPIPQKHGCAVSWSPLLSGLCADAESVIRHYALDRSCGWSILRVSFPWKTRRAPKLKSLSLTMTADRVRAFGPHFHAESAGQRVTLSRGGVDHVLTVRGIEAQTLDASAFPADRFYPTHYAVMTYTLSPEPPRGLLQIEDCARSDQPLKITPDDPLAPRATGEACVGIIGGADGPTAVFLAAGTPQQEALHSACSSLHFAPVAPAEIEWRAIFHETPCAPQTLALL